MKTVSLIFRSLFSNNACVEGGRKKPWYIAVPIFIISIILAILPLFTTSITSTGSSFLTSRSYIYDYDTGVVAFVESINDNDIDMIIASESDGTKYLSVDETKWNQAYLQNGDLNDIRFIHRRADDGIDFDVYFTNATGDSFTQYVNDVRSNYVPLTSPQIRNNFTNNGRQCSFIVFGRYDFATYLYAYGSTSSSGSVSGNYNHFNVGDNLRGTIAVYDNGNLVDRNSPGTLYQVYRKGVYQNFLGWFDVGYIDYRNMITWQTTLIMGGIDIVLTVFLGLLVFFLTRGKTNINRSITFWQSQKIAFWSALSPAVISLVAGYLLASMSYIFFPLCMGLRMMFLSMRSLRPQYSDQGQPTAKELAAYEAREKEKREREKQQKVINAKTKDVKPNKKK